MKRATSKNTAVQSKVIDNNLNRLRKVSEHYRELNTREWKGGEQAQQDLAKAISHNMQQATEHLLLVRDSMNKLQEVCEARESSK